MLQRGVLASLGMLFLVGIEGGASAQTALIPRQLLFGDPEQSAAVVSPDGAWIGYLAPRDGVLNIWVEPLSSQGSPRPVTHDRGRGIHEFRWQADSAHLLYRQDEGGEENFHLYQTNLAGEARDLTPFPHVHARIVGWSARQPQRLLVAMNRNDPKWLEVYTVDLESGQVTLDTANPGEADGFAADEDLTVRVATRTTLEGATEILVRSTRSSKWEVQKHWSPEESFPGVVTLSRDGLNYRVLASAGSASTRLLEIAFAGGGERVLGDSEPFDIDAFSTNPVDGGIDLIRTAADRQSWSGLTAAATAALGQLQKTCQGDIDITGRSLSDDVWSVACVRDVAPTRYYVFYPKTLTAKLLFSEQPALERFALAPMRPMTFTARDGMTIHGYLTLPTHVDPKRLPTVVLVHGGPWARDTWGLKADVQLLANRGYAVLQVNYRGSTGYGRPYLDAGDREWGGKMELDLIDAKNWAVKEGWSDPDRVAIMGASYGGYAALAGLAFYPGAFAAGVDMVGPSDLNTLKSSYAPFFTTLRRMFAKRVGDDPAFLKSRSPLYSADRITRPLFVAQSENDVHVTLDQSERIVSAMRRHGRTVRYLVIGDEGHTLSKPEDRLFLIAEIEAFLAKTIGGRAEPFTGSLPPQIHIR